MEKKNKASMLIWDPENLVSATECTGLIPSAVESSEEGEHYADLYAIHQQKPVSKKKKGN